MTPHRILIVDDEANIRRVLWANLKAAGYEAVAVSSGYSFGKAFGHVSNFLKHADIAVYEVNPSSSDYLRFSVKFH